MALKESSGGAALARLRLSIVFEGVEGHSETDYLVFQMSTDVGTAMAIARSHFMQKYFSSSLPPHHRTRTPRGESKTKENKEAVCECVALWTYVGEEADELSFKDGDVISVIAKPHKEWWTGELRGHRGIFPCAYVRELIQEIEDDPKDLILDPELYGLYLPPPLDMWLNNSLPLRHYGLVDDQVLHYAKLPVKLEESQVNPGRPTRQKTDISDHVERVAAAQRRDDIESALRLFAGSGNLSVDVFVKEISQSFSLEVSDVVLAKDVLALLAKQLKGRPVPGFQQEDVRMRDYGLVCRPKDGAVSEDLSIHIRLDDQIRNFVNKGKIELLRLQLHLKVEVESVAPEKHVIYLAMSAEVKVDHVISRILCIYPAVSKRSECEFYELFLQSELAGKSTSMHLDRDRTLRSYRLKEVTSTLIFRPHKSKLEKQMSSASDVMVCDRIFIIVKAPKLNISKTLSLDPNMSVGEIIQEFVRRINMTVPPLKVLQLYQERSREPLHPMRQLKTLNVNAMDTLILQLKSTQSSEQKRANQKDKRKDAAEFQHPALCIAISTFKMGPDVGSGLHVPEFLLRLQTAMEQSHIFMCPDILHSDSDDFAELFDLMTQLCPFGDQTCPLPVFTFNPDPSLTARSDDRLIGRNWYHPGSACNLVRHWLFRLPTRLLNHLSPPQIAHVCKNEGEACEEVFSYLPADAAAVFMWLLKFLVVIKSFSHINELTSRNIAQYIAPCLFGPKEVTRLGMDSQLAIVSSKVILDVLVRLIDNRNKQEEVLVTEEGNGSRSDKSKSWGRNALNTLTRKKKKEKGDIQTIAKC